VADVNKGRRAGYRALHLVTERRRADHLNGLDNLVVRLELGMAAIAERGLHFIP